MIYTASTFIIILLCIILIRYYYIILLTTNFFCYEQKRGGVTEGACQGPHGSGLPSRRSSQRSNRQPHPQERRSPIPQGPCKLQGLGTLGQAADVGWGILTDLRHSGELWKNICTIAQTFYCNNCVLKKCICTNALFWKSQTECPPNQLKCVLEPQNCE